MINRVLIANRGEIALRIARACRELDIQTVAVHSRVDANLRHLDLVDETVCISETSYLGIESVIAAATSRGCDAIHPGYGLLAENAEFAREVEKSGLVLIGPTAETMASLGDKIVARQLVSQHGLQVLPGSNEPLLDVQAARKIAADMGYPVMLKAAFGGGGRGMRVVDTPAMLESAFAEATAESLAGFGRGELYLEKFLTAPRHVEVQVLGDGAGRAIQLGTRDCSVQRNHQKLLEEAPAPLSDEDGLVALADQCARLASELSYRGAGTFEFLYEDGQFYFIEANTRIQVEHPVTEMITGLDIVKAQLQLAMTGELPLLQQDVTFTGHAIECRINAESLDTATGRVSPSPGLVYDYIAPGGPGVRVDSHLYNGYLVPHHYDSLVGKLVVWGRDRREARVRMAAALDEFRIKGIDTNIGLMQGIVASDRFREASIDTSFLDSSRSAS